MQKQNGIWIVTDTNSGVTPKESKKFGIGIIPMPFIVDGKEYFENVNLDSSAFYKYLKEGKDVSTSQPSVGSILDMFEEGLEKYESIVYIPMSSGLSGSLETAKKLAEPYGERIQVVDNHRISCTQKKTVFEALVMAKKGYTALEIKESLEKYASRSTIYIRVNTLEYLKKSGRVTRAGAGIATVLDIKPILQIQGGKLDAYTKSRGMKKAKRELLKAIENDINVRFKGQKVTLNGAYSGSDKSVGEEWKKEISEHFKEYSVSVDPLSLSVACHVGEGALGIACTVENPMAKNLEASIKEL